MSASDRLLRWIVVANASVGFELPRALVLLRRVVMGAAIRLLFGRAHLSDVLAALGGREHADADATAAASGRVLDALRRWPTTCLWRALASYAALAARGEAVRFLIGVRVVDGDLDAHAWIERGGVALAEASDPRERFAVAYVYPPVPAGAVEEARMSERSLEADVILTELQDGTGVLLHLGTKFYYALNATGVVVWKLLDAGTRDIDALARAVAERFGGVTVEQASADVAALIAELRAERLLRDGP